MGPQAEQFFKGWFNREVAEGLHYRMPGYCFRKIQKTVPREWWRYAVEGIYYRLPEIEDSGETEKWLDTAQVILPDPNVRSFLQMIRGTRLTATGDYTTALRCLQDSYTLALRCGQRFRANDAKRYLARCLKLRGEYPEAISLLMEVNYFFLDKPDFPHEVRKHETKLELARVYQISGDYPQALHWSRQAIEYARRNKVVGQEVEAIECLALGLLNMGRAEQAWEVLREAQTKRRTFAIYADSSNNFFLRGKALAELKRYQEALPLLRIAKSTNLEIKNRQKIAETDAAIADCFSGMRQADTALDYYRKSLALMTDISRKSYLHYEIADIFERKGLADSALYHTQMGTVVPHFLQCRQRPHHWQDRGKGRTRAQGYPGQNPDRAAEKPKNKKRTALPGLSIRHRNPVPIARPTATKKGYPPKRKRIARSLSDYTATGTTNRQYSTHRKNSRGSYLTEPARPKKPAYLKPRTTNKYPEPGQRQQYDSASAHAHRPGLAGVPRGF